MNTPHTCSTEDQRKSTNYYATLPKNVNEIEKNFIYVFELAI
jgi:hypothetical protein